MFLHHHVKVSTRHITAVTFTNKAAMEMKERMAAVGLSGVSVLTFHRLCLKLLRRYGWFHEIARGKAIHAPWCEQCGCESLFVCFARYGGAVGVPSGFTVADRSDQLAVISGILRGLGALGHVVAKEDVIEFATALKNRAIVGFHACSSRSLSTS